MGCVVISSSQADSLTVAVFLGAGWPPVLRALADHLVIDPRDLAFATVCANPDDAIAHMAKIRPGRPRAAGQPRG